jgi:hypothetical protein
MSFHRTILGVCTAVFATVFASAAFAQCCGGVAVAPIVQPVAVVQEVIQPVMAVPVPFARIENQGLLWLLSGGKIVELHRDKAIVETERGSRPCYRRRPVEVGRVVLAWELVPRCVPPSAEGFRR